MIGYIKTTLLLLLLVCVTKPIQAENDESTEKLTRSNDSKAVDSEANISDSSTLGNLENTTENVDKTTEDSTEEGETRKQNVLRDDIKTEEEKNEDHTLRRKRRSSSNAFKREYTRDGSDESEESDVSINSRSSSSECSEGLEFKAKFLNLLKSYLDQSCHAIDPSNSVNKNIEISWNKMNIGVKLDSNDVLSQLHMNKEDWEKYCNGPREINDVVAFYHNLFSEISKSDDDLSLQGKDLSRPHGGGTKRFFWLIGLAIEAISLIANLVKKHRAETRQLDGASIGDESEAQRFERYTLSNAVMKAVLPSVSSLIPGDMNDVIAYDLLTPFLKEVDRIDSLLSGVEDGSKPTGSAKIYKDEGPSSEKVLQRYCELSRGSSNIIMTFKALVKEFDEPNSSQRKNYNLEMFLNTLKSIVYKNSDFTQRTRCEAALIKGAMERYCEGLKRSDLELTSTYEEGDNTARSSKKILDDYIDGSRRSNGITLGYINYLLVKSCKPPESLYSAYEKNNFLKMSVKPQVRTKSSKRDSISEERRSKRSKSDDMMGWRSEGFEPDKGQNVPDRQMEKSSPRIFKKSKIRRLKNPKNFKNEIINLYNAKEIGTRTKSQKGQFSKMKIIGHKQNPSTSFEVKTGVEKDMNSKDYNPRLRCKVRTRGSMSDSNGRTGSSRGHTFSEVPSNDKKALLCSSETSEVHRPNKDVYIKQSVSGKSVVSYDRPDKYIRHNYSPSNENLEIGTSGSSTLNDTSNKNQSISVVSTDSLNADSMSRSETKFVQEKGGSERGMESSANVEGSIDAVLNKNPFITNSKQHSLGMIVENPDKNMENPLPVEKNEKLQTYSKFQRTEDFDINFRRFNEERTRSKYHRRRPQ